MAIITINHHPTRFQLRVFGVLWLLFFAVFAAGAHFQGASLPLVASLGGLAGLVPVVGWVSPGFMRMVYLGKDSRGATVKHGRNTFVVDSWGFGADETGTMTEADWRARWDKVQETAVDVSQEEFGAAEIPEVQSDALEQLQSLESWD